MRNNKPQTRLSRLQNPCQTALAIALGAVLVLTMPGTLSAQRAPNNYSSHSAEFFTRLLSGRVGVAPGHDGGAYAGYFGPDGRYLFCYYSPARNRYVGRADTWKVVIHSRVKTAELEINTPGRDNARRTKVIHYDAATGAFRAESWNRSRRKWRVAVDGWVQDKWPSALGNACAGVVELPQSLEWDRKQSTLSFEHIKATATPVTHFPGWEYGTPGATGLGASGGQPTMTLEETKAVWKWLNGRIFRPLEGGRMVLNDRNDHWEVWRLNKADNIIKVGISRLVEDGTIVQTQWDRGRTGRIRVGYPIPILPSPEFHPAFAMMQDLSKSGTPLNLAGKSSYVFASDGVVSRDGADGRWWLSRGAVYVEIDGQTTRTPWREFARQARWSPGN